MKIYLLPGLGYDCRIFENLDFKDWDVKCLNWIEPNQNEGLNQYAKRMFGDALNTKDKVVLIGHSLGAIVAQEIATVTKIEKIILISSIKSRQELPRRFKVIAPLQLHKLFTKELGIKTIKYWGEKHGFENSIERELFKSMIGNQTNKYLQWALKALSRWKTPILPKETSIFQVHGTHDKTFPLKLIKSPNALIKNGSHIMLYNQYQELNKILLEEIKTA